MKNKAAIEIMVGLFMVIAFLALAFLALRVSGLAANGDLFGKSTYNVQVTFPTIGSLKTRAPVRVAGVEIGTVSKITLNNNFFADVTLKISNKFLDLPDDSNASITASGLLGDNYVSISPGYSTHYLHNDSQMQPGQGATNILNLLSTFTGGKKSSSSTNNAKATK